MYETTNVYATPLPDARPIFKVRRAENRNHRRLIKRVRRAVATLTAEPHIVVRPNGTLEIYRAEDATLITG